MIKKKLCLFFVLTVFFNQCLWAKKPVSSLGKNLSSSNGIRIYALKPTLKDGKAFYTAPDAGFTLCGNYSNIFYTLPCSEDSYLVKSVVPYLLKSKEFINSALLRQKARQIRYELMPDKLKKSDYTKDQCEAVMKYALSSIKKPFAILNASPNKSWGGPALMPAGTEVVDKTGKKIDVVTSFIILTDKPNEKNKNNSVFLKDALENDTLDIIMCHENAHGIMADMYGQKFPDIKKPSKVGHDSYIISDKGTAFVEGWAEAFEAVYGPNNIKFNEKDRKKYHIAEFLFARQNPIRRDRYVWVDNKAKKNGSLKNGSQLMATEGVIAGLFYDILTSRAIVAPFEKCVKVMFTDTPQNFVEFFNALVKKFPEDKRVLYRILLENTHYATMTNDAIRAYCNYYAYKLKINKKKISKSEYLEYRKKYKTVTETLFKKAMSGSNVFGNVGPELWFYSEARADVTKTRYFYAHTFDLNTITAKQLKIAGMVLDEDVNRIISERSKDGYFSDRWAQNAFIRILGDKHFKSYIYEKYMSNFKSFAP